MAYTPVKIDGRPYAVRLPTGGAWHGAPSEWDSMLDTLGEKNHALHVKNILSWCQDTARDHPDCRVYRGQLSARHWNNTYHYRAYPHVGYRPVLEPLSPATLKPDPSILSGIPDGCVLTMGSFSVNGIPRPLPQDPVWCGDIPQYRDHAVLSIGDTAPDVRNQLRFIKCGGLLWCDRNLMTGMSWDVLSDAGLVYGQDNPIQEHNIHVRPKLDTMLHNTTLRNEQSHPIRSPYEKELL